MVVDPAESSPEALVSLGWDAAWAQGFERERAALAGRAEPGRVLRIDRSRCLVATVGGRVHATWGGGLLARVAGDGAAAPCTGDWCAVTRWPDGPVTVESVLPRRTSVVRAEVGGSSRTQILAANVDVVAVVASLEPEPVIGMVERMVALAWTSGATPVVVLTKTDLVHDAELVAADVAVAAPGVEVIPCSTVTGQGLGRLEELLTGHRTMCLLGSSGVGKSSLVNALAGGPLLATRELRADGKGRHTSVRRELVPLPSGGSVVDTPGLRGVGLVAAGEGVAATFADVEALVGGCRFRDCSHTVEPGCAVLDAVNAGVLPVRRLQSWRKLQREREWIATRTDARLRAERAREVRARTRRHRRDQQERPGRGTR